MRLEAQPPAWVAQAVLERLPSVRLDVGSVHRLEEEVLEIEMFVALGLSALLREHELQLIPACEDESCTGFRAHANPVEARWRMSSAVCLDRDLEAFGVQRVDERLIELQQRLAA